MFKAERMYCQANPRTGVQDWYFSSREGNIGPFASKESVKKALEEFVKFNIDNACDGGRGSANKKTKLTLMPNDSLLNWSDSVKTNRF
jgi:hypothetical protein